MTTCLCEHPGFPCPRTLNNRDRFGVELVGGVNETMFENFDIFDKIDCSGSNIVGFVRLSKLCIRS